MTYENSYLTGDVPLNRICYDYRDDIAYRIYIMMTEDWESMKIWGNLKHGRKSERHGSYKPKYLIDLLKLVIDTPVNKTKFAWNGAANKGRILKRVHFAFDKKTGIYYPAGGGSRLAIAYFLCHSYIPALLVSTEQGVAWKKNFGIGSKHFNGIPDRIIDKLLFRRKINNLFITGVINKKVKGEFLYKIPDLGFRGKYDRDDFLNDEICLEMIKGKKVLNLIQDNGYLEAGLSDHCQFVITVGKSVHYIKIASEIADYYKKDNIKYTTNVPTDLKYDIVLSMNSHEISNYCKHIVFSKKGNIFLGY